MQVGGVIAMFRDFRLHIVTALVASVCCPNSSGASFSFYSPERNRTYGVYTYSMGDALQFPGHWLYEVSPIIASAGTGGVNVLLFSSNRWAYFDLPLGEAIFYSWSNYTYGSFSTPVAVLTNTIVSNICDMAGAKPIYDGAMWHVYVQGVEGDFRTGNCGTQAAVYEATGPTLTNLSWVLEPGTDRAKKVLYSPIQGVGIGQDQQWYYTAGRGGPPGYPFLTTYNDWGYTIGAQIFGYLSPEGTNTMYYWYNLSPAYIDLASSGFTGFLPMPDALLPGSLDEGTRGIPGIGFSDVCATADTRYGYGKGIGFYPNLVPSVGSVSGGVAILGPLQSVASDSYGPRMGGAPSVARDSGGFIPLAVNGPNYRQWQTMIFYNPSQLRNYPTDPCNNYTRWASSDQKLSTTLLIINEM
jgi:hypothetical protein